MDHFHLQDGALHCEGVSLETLAQAVGTPTYVYSAATMDRHAAVMQAAVAGAGKGEPLVAEPLAQGLPQCSVLATLSCAGPRRRRRLHRRISSRPHAGIAPDKIVFSGVGKTPDEMALALAAAISQFNLESLEEPSTLSAVASALGRVAPIGFRINPDVSAGTHAKITTGNAENSSASLLIARTPPTRGRRACRASRCTGSRSISAASSPVSCRLNRRSAASASSSPRLRARRP